MNEHAFTIIQNIPAKALKIIHLMRIHGEPVSKKWMADNLRCARNTVDKYLAFLEGAGYIERLSCQKWELVGVQLELLGFGETFKYSKIERFVPTTTTNNSFYKSNGTVVSKNGNVQKLNVSSKLKQAFQEAGIGRSMWGELAGLSHMSPEYCQAHTALRLAETNPKRRKVALQIHCMRDGDPAPEWCSSCNGLDGEHMLGCTESYKRYSTGKYAELLEN